jgi:hypothetical protein
MSRGPIAAFEMPVDSIRIASRSKESLSLN